MHKQGHASSSDVVMHYHIFVQERVHNGSQDDVLTLAMCRCVVVADEDGWGCGEEGTRGPPDIARRPVRCLPTDEDALRRRVLGGNAGCFQSLSLVLSISLPCSRRLPLFSAGANPEETALIGRSDLVGHPYGGKEHRPVFPQPFPQGCQPETG